MTDTNDTVADVVEFVITRSLDAPRDLVWKAWTEQERMEWWGPKGVEIVSCEIDLRPGGMFHYCMQTEDGHEMWGRWLIREVAAPDRLVFVSSFSDAEGGITRHPASDQWPLEMLSTITFHEGHGKTLLTVKWIPINATAEEIKTFHESRESMQQGWSGSLERLEEYLLDAVDDDDF